MTFGRCKLLLGIANVGCIVTLCAVLLVFRIPEKVFFGAPQAPLTELGQLAVVLCGYALVSLPFDMIGGLILPIIYRKEPLTFFVWLSNLLRGVIVQTSGYICCGILLLHTDRALGHGAAIVAFGCLQCALLLLQALLATLVFPLRIKSGIDPIFSGQSRVGTGGIVGAPGFDKVLIPTFWRENFSPQVMELAVIRRNYVIKSGSRLRGIVCAFVWNLSGFTVAIYLSGGVGTVAGLVSTAMTFTLTSFVGLLLLPRLSQNAVIKCDSYLRRYRSTEDLDRYISAVATWQGDEEERSPLVERIFYPIPAVANRLPVKGKRSPKFDAWHAARLTIFLSWAGMSFLPRAVHCNVGRPDVWVLLPCD